MPLNVTGPSHGGNTTSGLDPHPMDAPTGTSEPGRSWEAELSLRFAKIGRSTRLVRRAHRGPLQVQRPFYPDDSGGCHLYVIHPPGGIVGGDRLTIQVDAEVDSLSLVTTPAATKFYRSAGAVAQQRVTVRVAPGALLEWLPQETIVFGGAKAVSSVRADVEAGGRFVAWDVCCLGRPLSGDAFTAGSYAPRLEVYEDGRPIYIERGRVEASGALRTSRVGLGGAPVFGSLVAVGVSDVPDLVERIRAVLPETSAEGTFAVTARRRALACRYLGRSAQHARSGFFPAWRELRQALSLPASPPRIWAT